MADDDTSSSSASHQTDHQPVDLAQKLDTVAGAVAQIARTHTELLAHVAETEARRSAEAAAATARLDGLHQAVEQQRDDLALALEVLARMAEAIERTDARTDDRLAAVRDAATTPVVDLQQMLAARGERTDARLDAMAESVAASVAALEARKEHQVPTVDLSPLLERIDDLAAAVQGLTWQIPEVGESLAQGTDELGQHLTVHTDTALAGVLRLIDARLADLRASIATDASTGDKAMGGFEAGAVMGAAQAAWNRLEQRLDHEFDDLGRQLQSMASLIEQAVTTAEAAEAAASRPVVTGEQLRKAATSVKDSVLGAGRSRRERRGGPRSLGPGHDEPPSARS